MPCRTPIWKECCSRLLKCRASRTKTDDAKRGCCTFAVAQEELQGVATACQHVGLDGDIVLDQIAARGEGEFATLNLACYECWSQFGVVVLRQVDGLPAASSGIPLFEYGRLVDGLLSVAGDVFARCKHCAEGQNHGAAQEGLFDGFHVGYGF